MGDHAVVAPPGERLQLGSLIRERLSTFRFQLLYHFIRQNKFASARRSILYMQTISAPRGLDDQDWAVVIIFHGDTKALFRANTVTRFARVSAAEPVTR